MHIPSRVEVLSWNENQVADLLREHKLMDCVDCVYQRHIDGQKLLNLKEGDVTYFLEIQDKSSRGKLWNIVKRITEKRGGVGNLVNKFQVTSERNNSGVEEDNNNESDEDTDDSFEDDPSDDYDTPDEDTTDAKSVTLERKETIKRNLMSFMSNMAPTINHEVEDEHSSYPTSEEIYDVPEDGCGEPDEDMYDVPSDESGGGVVTRQHAPLERRESDQYLVPDNTKLIELSETIDEDYEDLGGAPPPGRSGFDLQEEYVVPDTKPAAVPPRPPKPSADSNPKPQKAPPVENGHRKPVAKNNSIRQLQEMLQQRPASFVSSEPQRDLKKPKIKKQLPSDLPKPYLAKDHQKLPAKPPHTMKKPPVEPDQETYEPPDQPPRYPKKPAINNKPPPEIEQESYEAPETPARHPKKPAINNKPPVQIEQESYEAPETPARHPKKPAINNKPPVQIEQESYEAPETPARHSKKPAINNKPRVEIETEENYEAPDTPLRPTSKPQPHIAEPMQENYEPPEPLRRNKPVAHVELDPEETYEAPDMPGMNQDDADGGENYEVPDSLSQTSKEVSQESTKKSAFSKINLFNRSPSKKVPPTAPPKLDKRKTKKNEPPVPLPSTAPPVAENNKPPVRRPPNPVVKKKSWGEKPVDKRVSMALPSLPSQSSPTLPPKPPLASEIPPHNRPVPTPGHRPKPGLPPSKPPQMTKEQMLQEQPWFHGLISKTAVAEFLKSAKKDGAYLVRISSRDPGKCIISIYYKNDIRHLNIPCENGHYRLGDSGSERFKSIEELVSYFNKHDVEFSAGGKTHLTHACMKR